MNLRDNVAGGNASPPHVRAPIPADPTDRDITTWLALLFEPGQVVELRALGSKAPHKMHVERFPASDLGAIARKALRLSNTSKAVYVVMNGVNPALPLGPSRDGAKDTNVPRRRWLLIDADPTRPAETSSTHAEKAEACELAAEVRDALTSAGWPAPILADSSNGYHLLYRVDLPPDDGELVKALLNSLADRFDRLGCKIDRVVFNPSRIVKLYGTRSRKGLDTPERPHRLSRVLDAPAEACIVPRELVEAEAAKGPPVKQEAPGFDVAGEIDRKRVAAAEAPRRPTNGKPGLSAEERAIAYLAKCEPAVSGQVGHNKAFKAACKIGPGFDLAPDVAIRLLRDDFNPRCIPPWSEKELRHKVEDAYRVETRRGWLRDTPLNGRGPGRNGPGRPQPNGDGGPTERPTVIITTDEHIVIRESIAALRDDPRLYQRSAGLVTIVRDAGPDEGIKRPAGTPRIAPMPSPRLRELLVENVSLVKRRRDDSGEWKDVPSHPPEWLIPGLMFRGEWPGIRYLGAIVETPLLRLDGTVLDRPGYDRSTGLIYEPGIEFPPLPARLSLDDAKSAAAELLALVADFPLKDEAHRAAWLAALLTPLGRFGIRGPCPLFLFDANAPGSGKTLLCDLVGLIATGRGMPRTAYPDSDDEMRKRITSIALAGDRMMLIDNIASTFGGSALDGALTAATWRDRILGRSELTAELPLFTVWYGTGNNVTIRGDMMRRVVPIRLEAMEERPEERTGFAHPQLMVWALQERPRLVTAALTILRAYVVAGRPDQKLTPFGGFESWSGCIRSAIVWTTGIDPWTTRKDLIESDPEGLARASLVEGWAELPGSSKGLTVAEAMEFLKEEPSQFAALRAAMLEMSKNTDLPSARMVGKHLKAIQDRVINGKAIRSKPYQGTQRWRVTTTSSSCLRSNGG